MSSGLLSYHESLTAMQIMSPMSMTGKARTLLMVATSIMVAATIAATAQAQTMRGSLPSATYFAAFRNFFDGNYDRAADAFQAAGRLGRQSVDGRWVDGVCYHTMIGECLFKTGKFDQALEQYNTAVRIFLRHRKFMQRVQFPANIVAEQTTARNQITWARRQSSPGRFTDYSTLFGDLNAGQTLETGGVFAKPELRSVHVAEIMRCVTLSIKRRGELLGPLVPFDSLNSPLIGALESRLVPANHWAQAWVDVARGMVLASVGRQDDADLAWKRGTLIQGYDHPLTGFALLQLGRSAAVRGQTQAAADLFLQASAAAAAFEQVDLVAECFEAMHELHLQGELVAAHPAFAVAIDWANRNRARQLRNSLLLNSAEQMLALDQVNSAISLFRDAAKGQGRRARTSIQNAAQTSLIEAAIHYRQAKTEPGDKALGQALELQREASLWLFQIRTANRLYRSGSDQLTPRSAAFLYETLLREPVASDWQAQPLDTLVFLKSSLEESFENWFEVSLERADESAAIQVVELMKRHRYFSQLPLGGRLMALRWILHGPVEKLDAVATARRDELLAKFPDYADAVRKVTDLQRQLRDLSLEDDEAAKARLLISKQIAEVSAKQERMLSDLALRREFIPIAFPPNVRVKFVQSRLNPAQVIWGFSHQSRGLYAFMLSSKYAAVWKVDRPKLARKAVTKMLSDLGMRGPNQPVTVVQLSDNSWQEPAEQVLGELLEPRQRGFWRRYEELIVVPDGFLWYLPFEATWTEDDVLVNKIRVRYVPLLSMAASQDKRPQRKATTVAVIGQLFPREDADVTADHFGQMQRVVDNLVALPPKLGVPIDLIQSTWERLLVLDDIDDANQGPFDWSIKSPGAKSTSTLANWLSLPWGAPQQIMLPGFHTAAEKTGAKGDGTELFTTLVSMMSEGPRTIILARWRTGGQSSYDLMREWLQESDVSCASEAWRRAVQVVRGTEVDSSWEPRVNARADDPTIKAEHPFFWAGYLLVDTGVGTPTPVPRRPSAAETVAAGEG